VCRSGEKSLTSYFILFSLPNIYMQINPSGMVVGDATTNIALATPSPA
jgi:hypothetical protein